MKTDRPRHKRHDQLQLPLPAVAAGGRQGTDDEWRLDEHTRRVGRAGVAAARALLEEPAFPGGSASSGRDPRSAGRAA